ncbi:MAG: DUF1624 domain-containing protein, partial [Planctomycetes bacterium]|nr:DUF1624 domain-containing protein [Planctomycetota bacterium]
MLTGSKSRLAGIDALRGVAMVLMVLDHVRDFMGRSAAPELIPHVDAPLFLTRWVTHFCAPVFVLLAGVGAGLYGSRVESRGALARFLVTRGLWLVLLELTLVHVAWNFALPSNGLVALQVIWALGWSMVLLAGLVWLGRGAILVLCLPLLAFHEQLAHTAIEQAVRSTSGVLTEPGAVLWSILHVEFRPVLRGNVLVLYTVVPWCALMGFGYALAPALAGGARRRVALGLGMVLIAAFVLLRRGPLDPDRTPVAAAPWIEFLNCSKYPPSVMFLLMTLGPALVGLALLDRLPEARVTRWLATFGRVPLFFYVLHLFVAHAVGVVFLRATTGAWHSSVFTAAPPPGTQASLPAIYMTWAGVVCSLYPVCRWFMAVKARHRGA